MADTPNPIGNNFFDKLQSTPEDKQTSGIKLTLQSIETKVENLVKYSKKQISKHSDKLNIIIKKSEEYLKTDSEILEYMTNFIKKNEDANKEIEGDVYKATEEMKKETSVDLFPALEKRKLDKKIETTIQANDKNDVEIKNNIDVVFQENNKRTAKIIEIGSTFFGKSWNVIKKFGLSLYSGTKTISKIVGNGKFCSFFDNTLGKAFRIFQSHGPTLGTFIGTSTVIWSGLKMISTGMIWVVEKLWDGFKSLAKIGWKVISGLFTAVTTTITSIGKWFIKQLINFASSPLGVVLLIAGITVAAVAAYWLFWKPVKNLVIYISKLAWNWINKQVKNILGIDPQRTKETKEDYEKRIKLFEKRKAVVLGFVNDIYDFITNPDGLLKFYDDHIGKKIGFESKDIKLLWSEGIDFLKRGFSIFVNIFTTIKNENLFDELLVVWTTLKQIVIGKEAYRDELVMGENETRAYAGLQKSIQSEAEAYVQSQILEEVFRSYKGIVNDKNRKDLISYGQQRLQFFLNNRKFSLDVELNKKILSKIFISVGSIVDKFFKEDRKTLRHAQYKSSDEVVAYQEATSDILKVINDRNFKASTFAGEISQQLDKILPQLVEENNDYIAAVTHSNIEADLLPSSFLGIQMALRTNKLNTINQTLLDYKDNHNMLEDLNMQLSVLAKKIKTVDPTNILKIALSIVFNKNYDEIQKTMKGIISNVDNILSPFNIFKKNQPIKQANGGIVTGPVHALVGEAGYPEIVIPLNKDGLNFVNSSMNILDIKEELPRPKNYKQHIMKRLTGSSSGKSDFTVFDMKNLSYGSIGIV